MRAATFHPRLFAVFPASKKASACAGFSPPRNTRNIAVAFGSLEAPAEAHAHQNGIHLEGADLGASEADVVLMKTFFTSRFRYRFFCKGMSRRLAGQHQSCCGRYLGQAAATLEKRVVHASTHVGLEAGSVEVVLHQQRRRQVLERTDLASSRTERTCFLGHSQNQLSSDVGVKKYETSTSGITLSFTDRPKPVLSLLALIQVHGTGTHEPRAFGLLRKRSARSQCAKNGHGQQVFLHTELNAVERGRPRACIGPVSEMVNLAAGQIVRVYP